MGKAIEILLSACVGALLAHSFWRVRFRETRTADYYREVLEKLISPFYLWLLYGRIKTRDRRLDSAVPAQELERMIVFSEGDDKKIVEVLKNNAHLAAVDQRLFSQIEEFLSCYEFNYESRETRQKVFIIYQAMKSLFEEYSKKYEEIMLLNKISFFQYWWRKVRNKGNQ